MSPSEAAVQALSALPHGPEFRFVDSIMHLEPGVSATALHHVRADSEMLRGHFPGAPLLPGVIMVEALAQLGGVVVQSRPGIAPLPELKLTAITRFKILASVGAGESITLQARLDSVVGTLAQISGQVCSTRTGQLLATGTVMLAAEGPPAHLPSGGASPS